MQRWLGILVVVSLVLGCEMWADVADFFDSGFADDDDGGGGGGEDLTPQNLEGSWELDLEASTIDDDTRLTEGNLRGTWTVSGDLPDGFLAEFGATIDTATAVSINENTFTFQTEDPEDTDPAIDYDIIDTDTVELTEGATTREVQVVLTTTGTTTTMTITDGTDTGTFTSEGHTTITSYDLSITETQFVTTIVRSDTTRLTITETYEILDDGESIQLTQEVTNEETVVDAALSSDGDRLTLTYPDEAGGGTGVFNRVGGGNGNEEDDEQNPDDEDPIP